MSERASCAGGAPGLASAACRRRLERPVSAVAAVAGHSPSAARSTRSPRSFRRCGAAIQPFRVRPADAFQLFDARASATAWIVAEGVSSLDDAGRRRVVDGWRRHPVPWRRSRRRRRVRRARRRRRARPAAARKALLHWLPLSQPELALFDGGLFADDPAGAIALLVRPPTIWPLEEAVRAERRFRRGPRFEPERFEATRALCTRPTPRRAAGPPRRRRTEDRGPTPDPAFPSCERDRGARQRCHRCRSRALPDGRGPTARALCLELAGRSGLEVGAVCRPRSCE